MNYLCTIPLLWNFLEPYRTVIRSTFISGWQYCLTSCRIPQPYTSYDYFKVLPNTDDYDHLPAEIQCHHTAYVTWIMQNGIMKGQYNSKTERYKAERSIFENDDQWLDILMVPILYSQTFHNFSFIMSPMYICTMSYVVPSLRCFHQTSWHAAPGGQTLDELVFHYLLVRPRSSRGFLFHLKFIVN